MYVSRRPFRDRAFLYKGARPPFRGLLTKSPSSIGPLELSYLLKNIKRFPTKTGDRVGDETVEEQRVDKIKSKE